MDKNKIESALSSYEHLAELKRYSTIGLGGPARYLVEARTIKQLIAAVSAARSVGMPYKIFGFGSNLLISDKGFDGLVIVNRTSTIQIDKSKSQVIAEGGLPLSKLILEAASNGLSGFETMFGIPGTVGGAICVNAGAHNKSISSHLKTATIMISSEKIINVDNNWFNFEYRSSRLKYKKEEFPPVILSAIFQFQQKKPQDISEEIAKYKIWREDHQPLGEKTTGSVFRNPSAKDKNDDSKERTAGYLLEQSGAKRLRIGGIRVSKKHANWIINDGTGSAEQARKLIEEMRDLVEANYSLTLEEEIEYFGNWQ